MMPCTFSDLLSAIDYNYRVRMKWFQRIVEVLPLVIVVGIGITLIRIIRTIRHPRTARRVFGIRRIIGIERATAHRAHYV